MITNTKNLSAHSRFLSVLLLLSLAACSNVATPKPTAIPTTAIPPTIAPTDPPSPTVAPTPTAPLATPTAAAENKLENFGAAKFDKPIEINNAWMPLNPGTRYVYEGSTTADDGTLVPHRIEIHVTDLAKVIGGVPSLATWDLDFSNNVLAEAELAFFAQDNAGNVWRMGEYPEVYEEGKMVEAPSWIHGFQNAQAGIMMPANPQPGTPSYSQGWGPAVNWTDRGQVDQIGQKTCVPLKCFEDVLIVAETSQSEPGAQQLKYWAKNIGNVRVGWRGDGEKTKEVLELTKMEQLDEQAMTKVRAEARNLEQSAYQNSPQVYANTPPLVPAAEAKASIPAASQHAEATTQQTGGIVSADLLAIEAQVEDIMDVLPSDDWATVNENLTKVEETWASYQKQAEKDGAPQALLDGFKNNLTQLKTAATDKKADATMQLANDLSADIVDLYDVYHPGVPTDLGRLDVLERQVIIDISGADFARATATLAKINSVWERVKPTMLALKVELGKTSADQYDKSLVVQDTALKAQDAKGLRTEALNALEIIDALDRAAASAS